MSASDLDPLDLLAAGLSRQEVLELCAITYNALAMRVRRARKRGDKRVAPSLRIAGKAAQARALATAGRVSMAGIAVRLEMRRAHVLDVVSGRRARSPEVQALDRYPR